MLVFSVGGDSIHLSSFYLLLSGMVLLAIAGFLLGLSRGRRVVLQRSGLTDEFAMQLGRIADTLKRIANQSADRSITEASRALESSPVPEGTAAGAPREQTHLSPY